MVRYRAAIRHAIRAERIRCAGWVALALQTLQPTPASVSSNERWADLLDQTRRAIRVGKRLPVVKPKGRRRTCSYCLGEEGPENHNQSTCARRFRDLASGGAKAGASSTEAA